MRHRRRGVALFEVLVALMILTTAGSAIVGLLGGTLAGERGLRERERALAAADRVLVAMTLLTREDLDRRVGRREVGEFVVDVERPEPTLYRVAIADAQAPEVEALVTVLYRPGPHGS